MAEVNTPRNRAADADRPTPRARSRAPLAAVRRVSDERAYLYELIQTIGAGPDLEAILRGVVRLVTEATACHACFVYFLTDDTLVLRAASRMYEHLEGTVRIPVGEGLTGWVASARRSAFIKEGALEDSRVRRAWFPELEDEVYQSLVSVPIFSRSGEVLGVITLHAEAPHEFGRADLDFLEHTAALIGGAVENARLFEEATARVGILRSLASVSERIASSSNRDEVLVAVTEGVRELLGATIVEVHLLDPEGRASLAMARPSPREVSSSRPGDVPETDPWSDAEGWTRDIRRAARVRWGDDAGVPLFVPLIATEERLGMLAVLLPAAVPDAELALASVAAHAAVALKQHEMVERLQEESALRDLFRSLSTGRGSPDEISRLSRRLGLDLDREHVVVIVNEPSGEDRGERSRDPDEPLGHAFLRQLERMLVARFSGAVVELQRRCVRALVPVIGESADELLVRLRSTDWGGAHDPVVGVSNPCSGVASFSRGFEEAAAAAAVGGLLRGGGGVSSYDDLGPYRYVLAQEGRIRDATQSRIQELVAYDAERGTALLDTLDAYLDHRGNVVATSRTLFIHANTLRQRLERIQRVAGIDLEHEDWLSLAVATKVVNLRRIRTANAPEGGRDG